MFVKFSTVARQPLDFSSSKFRTLNNALINAFSVCVLSVNSRAGFSADAHTNAAAGPDPTDQSSTDGCRGAQRS